MTWRSGFTLIELTVVLLIVTLVFMIAAPQVGSVFPQMGLKSNARELASALRESRSRAIMTKSDVVFSLDVNRHQYLISGDERIHALLKSTKLTLNTAREELDNGSGGGIRFFPDGSSTGGSIVLSSSDRSYKVNVDWLTGRVVVED